MNKDQHKSKISRRKFIQGAVASAVSFTIVPRHVLGGGKFIAPSDKITLGYIGLGKLTHDTLAPRFLEIPETQVVAGAEVDRQKLERFVNQVNSYYSNKNQSDYKGCDGYGDFRELLSRNDIDGVIIATPDHWHALPMVLACQAGKDVYVEKPVSLTIGEGRKMVEAARKYERVVQVGTQQRSDNHFQSAVELVRSGALGRISFVRTWNTSNEYPQGVGAPPDTAPPPGLDWDMWLGPAPARPYNVNRFGVILDDDLDYTRWASWRWFWDYGGGLMTDWGVHWLDIVQWAMDVEAPQSVTGMGEKFYLQDNRETPDTLQVTYQYPDFVCVYENRLLNNHGVDGHGGGIIFYGTEGTMYLSRGGYKVTPQPGSSLEPLEVEETGAEVSHRRNFLNCIKSRETPMSDIEIGHRSSSVAMLGNIALRTGRRLSWDARTERVRGDVEANALVEGTYRAPWSIEI